MVAARWRRLTQAARWKGQAPHSTTGVARASDTHCHRSNCSPGIMARATTGTVRALHTASRARRGPVASAGESGVATRAV